MLKKLLPNLQLFGEGGDGGDGGSASSVGENAVGTSGENEIPSFVPEKAKHIYQKALEKTQSKTKSIKQTSEPVQTTDEPKATEAKLSYQDLIKSDDYKEEHKAYMDKTIGDRLKKYKGMEESLTKQKELLEIVANKYGANPDDENFLEVLSQKIQADDSYYENYAMEHDMSPEEARRIVTMERKVAKVEAEKQAQREEEQRRQHFMRIQSNAEKTKAQFPNFDLNTEMQNENFLRLCAVNNGDTTAAYMACHWQDIIPAQVQMASERIQAQTAQAVASNQARPIENGISSSAPSVVEPNFKGMNAKELREYYNKNMRNRTGR